MMSLKTKILTLLILILCFSCSKSDETDNDNTIGDALVNLSLSNGDFNGTYAFENFTFNSNSSTPYIGTIDSGVNKNTASISLFYSLVFVDLAQLSENKTLKYNNVELFLNINDVGYRGFSGGVTITRFRLAPPSYGKNIYVVDGNFNLECTNDSRTKTTTATGEFKNILIECTVCTDN
ncbi:hypothetical protein [Gelatiniphilus marinus]|uniref:Lipoprotein n=1 Tax=Gelatiniphilus marinus TaxID=1759464 RepID=A0ABW5JRV2_9FLAO